MDRNRVMPALHYFPGGWAFFSSFGNPRMQFNTYWGMFVTTVGSNRLSNDNITMNANDDWDLPITALLIPY
jgi:hypothetical protein